MNQAAIRLVAIDVDGTSLDSLTPRPALWEKRHTASTARFTVETAFAHEVEPNVFDLETWRVRTTNE